ncbi:MAG: chemotaxis protein CheD [Cyclobacteriaceae bacterium]|nr:chemotaxis protein CheD [Cyclobacteriaceae bacterium]
MIEYKLNIGDIAVCDNQNVTITCVGLGSCIGVFLQDRTIGLCGGAHIQLPGDVNMPIHDDKYYSVKSALDELINQFKIRGSSTQTLRAKITGGASVVRSDNSFQTGKKNAERITNELVLRNIFIAASDMGGHLSRTARFNCQSGELNVRHPETNQTKTY